MTFIGDTTSDVLTELTEIPVVWYLLSRHFKGKGEQFAAGRIAAACFFANMATLSVLIGMVLMPPFP